MNEVNKPKKLAGCVAAACPAVYEEDDQYIIVGKTETDDAVPQSVPGDDKLPVSTNPC